MNSLRAILLVLDCRVEGADGSSGGGAVSMAARTPTRERFRNKCSLKLLVKIPRKDFGKQMTHKLDVKRKHAGAAELERGGETERDRDSRKIPQRSKPKRDRSATEGPTR